MNWLTFEHLVQYTTLTAGKCPKSQVQQSGNKESWASDYRWNLTNSGQTETGRTRRQARFEWREYIRNMKEQTWGVSEITTVPVKSFAAEGLSHCVTDICWQPRGRGESPPSVTVDVALPSASFHEPLLHQCPGINQHSSNCPGTSSVGQTASASECCI